MPTPLVEVPGSPERLSAYRQFRPTWTNRHPDTPGSSTALIPRGASPSCLPADCYSATRRVDGDGDGTRDRTVIHGLPRPPPGHAACAARRACAASGARPSPLSPQQPMSVESTPSGFTSHTHLTAGNGMPASPPPHAPREKSAPATPPVHRETIPKITAQQPRS